MRLDHIGIPTTGAFEGEIPLPHLKITVSDHQDNPFGVQWQRYGDDAPYPRSSCSRSTTSSVLTWGPTSQWSPE
jgi:hypothetical protein